MRAAILEAVIVVLAAGLGYAAVAVARPEATGQPTIASVRLTVPATATVAPAVTFTPVPNPTPVATPAARPTAVPTIMVTSGLPGTPTRAPTSTPTPKPTPVVYVVQSGDSLDGIARRFGVSVDAIVRANHLSDPNTLAQGQRLIIPGR